MSSRYLMQYAVKDGRTVYIDDVARGKDCGCICPYCQKPLMARQGEKNIHSFVHYKAAECEYGYETSLHLLAKEILSESKALMLPPVVLHFPSPLWPDEEIREGTLIPIDHVELEEKNGSMIPDVVITSKGKKLLIEITVTHKVDPDKARKAYDADSSLLEIRLGKAHRVMPREQLEKILLSETSGKKWIYNSYARKAMDRYFSAADKKEIQGKNQKRITIKCPLVSTSSLGNGNIFMDVCSKCRFCLTKDQEIYCMGNALILKTEDFKLSPEERKRKYTDAVRQQRKEIQEMNTDHLRGKALLISDKELSRIMLDNATAKAIMKEYGMDPQTLYKLLQDHIDRRK